MAANSKSKGYNTTGKILIGIVFLFCFCASWCWLEKKYPVEPYSHCVFEDGAYIDMYEYQFLCVNLFAEGRFPVLGFLKPESCYKFCVDDTTAPPMGELFLDICHKAGPVTITTRPPVYILFVALTYKLFGYDIGNAVRLNFFMLSMLVAAMVTGSILLWGITGFFTGAISGVLFLHFSPFNPYYLLPDITVVLFVLLFFWAFVWAANSRQIKRYFITGLFLGLVILTKGILAPLFVLLVLGLVRYDKSMVTGIKKSISFAGGVLLLLIPWMIFINPVNQQTKTERDRWKQALDKNYRIVKYPESIQTQLMGEHGNKTLQTQALKSLINYFYRYYMETPPFIVLTSQLVPGAFLRYHNEYCTDGDIHAEYILFKNSFYNRIDEKLPSLKKIFLFYKTNPILLLQIAVAKLKLAFLSDPFPIIIWSVIFSSLTLLLSVSIKGNTLLSHIFTSGIVLLTLVSVYYEPVNNILLLLSIVLPLGIFVFIKKTKLTPGFLILQFLWFTLVVFTIIFNGDSTYVGIIEPVCWIIFISSSGKLFKRLLEETMVFISK